ncbi:MAG: dephospho-CoA kinase [Maricaulis sp.]|jgi:dephospho-CoA kinase|nr:dephospho-CoA kinase [Maricaulis sp.]MDG2043969.1 dephospho-CoA kinase [Maricaulis sp.]
MMLIGLTGSIGMGKSATAELFMAAGIAVFDSDACVHELYGPGGGAVAAVEGAFPGVAGPGGIDRRKLSAALGADSEKFRALEAIVHPLVNQCRAAFVLKCGARGDDLIIFDIPLLFETGGDGLVDKIVVVSAPDAVRRKRVLERPGMTADKLDAIIARQMPDAEKRARADYVVETSGGLDDAREQVDTVLASLRANLES